MARVNNIGNKDKAASAKQLLKMTTNVMSQKANKIFPEDIDNLFTSTLDGGTVRQFEKW